MATIIGTPAGSMATAGFDAGSTRAGERGEQIVAQILGEALSDSPATIVHDLSLPDGGRANVDHVVVAGDRVLIIDAKCWQPGIYWSFGHTPMRGLRPFPPASKRLLPLAHRMYSEYLPWARVLQPLMVVTPSSSSGRCRTGFLSVEGARVVPAHRAAKVVRRALGFGTLRPADPAIIAALTPLVRR